MTLDIGYIIAEREKQKRDSGKQLPLYIDDRYSGGPGALIDETYNNPAEYDPYDEGENHAYTT